MNTKLESLVKFLEEERLVRKKLNDQLQERDIQLKEAEIKVKNDRQDCERFDNMAQSMQKDLDRMKIERDQALDAKNELSCKLLDAEARLRISNQKVQSLEEEIQKEKSYGRGLESRLNNVKITDYNTYSGLRKENPSPMSKFDEQSKYK